MSEATVPAPNAAEAPVAAEAAPKKKSKLVLIIGLIAALLGAGGGGYWFFVMRPKAAAAKGQEAGGEKKESSGHSEEEAEKPAKEKKTEKSHDEEDEEESEEESLKASEESESKSARKPFRLVLPDDRDVKHVIELQPFIINLADEGSSYYLRMTVSVGIGDSKEEKPEALFITRVRNALLAVLTTKTSEEVLTPQGKETLRKQLLRAARKAVEEPEVQAIYITDLIVQL